MPVIKPAPLRKGDVIGIVAPASPPSTLEKITKGAEYLERLGYRVTLGRNVHKVYGYLAGTDEERAADINSMFADRTVKAVIAVRGGYGTPRLLPLLDYRLIRRNPKILVGYSDLTALQLAIFRKTGLVTFSGPMAGVEMWKSIDPFTEEHFWRTVTSSKKQGPVPNPDGRPLLPLVPGTASGRLLGGNLSLITAIHGTPYAPSYRDALLFIEEIEEECYRFDRMMNHLRIARVFEQVRGTVIGELTDVKASDTSKPFLTAEQILTDMFAGVRRPAARGLVYGHVPRKVTMPIGIRATLDSRKGTLSFDEGAVSSGR
ncbi:MAG: LD-carboxypeptidase [Bacteroidetes bacterium]|nr:MAG: LD-carboxypeptidase [Bacteroidota bacterium]